MGPAGQARSQGAPPFDVTCNKLPYLAVGVLEKARDEGQLVRRPSRPFSLRGFVGDGKIFNTVSDVVIMMFNSGILGHDRNHT